ncbi:hypothetical protein AALA80_15670 [Oscillospiraceae bacterium 50-60]
MAVSKAQIRATVKYKAKTYDKTLIRLPKGRLDEIRAHIGPAGESLNGLIGRAIAETMERDGGGNTVAFYDGIPSNGAAAPGAVQQKVETAPAGQMVTGSQRQILQKAHRRQQKRPQGPGLHLLSPLTRWRPQSGPQSAQGKRWRLSWPAPWQTRRRETTRLSSWVSILLDQEQ